MNKIILDKDFLHTEYIDNKKSIIQISNDTKIPVMTIYDAMIKYQIPIRKSKKFQIPKDILYIEYVENNKTMKEIGKIFGCSNHIIKSLLKKYNIKTRIGKNIHKISIISHDLLKSLYIDENLRIRQIANKLGMSERYIRDKLKEFNIPRKRKEKKLCQVNLVDQKFGRLTVVSLKEITYDGYIWLCNCQCGEQTEVLACNLLSEHQAIKSCGCARSSNVDWKIIPPWFWNNLPKQAKSRGIEFSLTKEYVENLFMSQNEYCALSGVKLNFSRSREKTLTTASLDRINSNKGYIENNVQWIHKTLNRSKNTIPNNEFINWCKLVAENNK
jgi:transposase